MAGINAKKYSANIFKQLNKKGLLKDYNVLRIGTDVFGAKKEDLYVCTIKAYYFRESSTLSIKRTDSASVTMTYTDKLLIPLNSDEGKLLRKDDYLTIDEIDFFIKDINNLKDIVLDITLERK